jgi:hypothetical protein
MISMPANDYIESVVLGLLITAAVYSLPIIIFRYMIRRKPVSPKWAKIITIIYGLVALFAMFILLALSGQGAPGGAIVLWSYINYRMLKSGYGEEITGPPKGMAQPPKGTEIDAPTSIDYATFSGMNPQAWSEQTRADKTTRAETDSEQKQEDEPQNSPRRYNGEQRMLIETADGFHMSMTPEQLKAHLDNKGKTVMPRADRQAIKDEIVSRIYGAKETDENDDEGLPEWDEQEIKDEIFYRIMGRYPDGREKPKAGTDPQPPVKMPPTAEQMTEYTRTDLYKMYGKSFIDAYIEADKEARNGFDGKTLAEILGQYNLTEAERCGIEMVLA